MTPARNIRLRERSDGEDARKLAEGDGAKHWNPAAKRGWLTSGQLAAQMGITPRLACQLVELRGVKPVTARSNSTPCVSPEMAREIKASYRGIVK